MNRRSFFKALGLLAGGAALPPVGVTATAPVAPAAILSGTAVDVAREYAVTVRMFNQAAADLDRLTLVAMARGIGILA